MKKLELIFPKNLIVIIKNDIIKEEECKIKIFE